MSGAVGWSFFFLIGVRLAPTGESSSSAKRFGSNRPLGCWRGKCDDKSAVECAANAQNEDGRSVRDDIEHATG